MKDLEKQLENLPPLLAVAFAARCGRRVQPLCRFDGGRRVDLEAIDFALAYAELCANAANTTIDDNKSVVGGSAYAALNYNYVPKAVSSVAKAAAEATAAADNASASGRAAVNVKASAFEAANAARARAAKAARAAVRAAEASAKANARDLAMLVQLGANGIDHIDPTPSGLLGPYWLLGQEPEWWPTNAELSQEEADTAKTPMESEVGPPAVFVAYDPTRVDPEDYAKLIAALGDVVRANGGDGIVHLRTEGYDLDLAKEPVLR